MAWVFLLRSPCALGTHSVTNTKEQKQNKELAWSGFLSGSAGAVEKEKKLSGGREKLIEERPALNLCISAVNRVVSPNKITSGPRCYAVLCLVFRSYLTLRLHGL